MNVDKLKKAIRGLHQHLTADTQPPWLFTVGCCLGGEASIIVYVNKKSKKTRDAILAPLLRDGWDGYPVAVKHMGVVRPARGE